VDRGPMALFGAIVAVGLGPAMWLGAQFGAATETADRPPAVTTVQQNVTPTGGSGAGAAPTGTGEITDEPAANDQPPRSTRTVRPKATKASPSPSESEESPTPPVETSSPGPSKSPADPSEESTTPPTDPPTKDVPGVPPPPPSDEGADQGDVRIDGST
jgi:hypothetical protein